MAVRLTATRIENKWIGNANKAESLLQEVRRELRVYGNQAKGGRYQRINKSIVEATEALVCIDDLRAALNKLKEGETR